MPASSSSSSPPKHHRRQQSSHISGTTSEEDSSPDTRQQGLGGAEAYGDTQSWAKGVLRNAAEGTQQRGKKALPPKKWHGPPGVIKVPGASSSSSSSSSFLAPHSASPER